jgi:phage terminase large subunit
VNHDISTINATKSVLDGIAYVQMIVEQGKLIVAPKCVHLLAALDQFRWDPKETLITEKPVHDKYSHMADALRYALYSYRSNVGTF